MYLITIGDSVLVDVRPRFDIQLHLGTLLPVLPAFVLLSFSTVSTLMFAKGLVVGADSGDYVLELVEDLDLEGPCVGGKFGLGVQRCLGSLLNLGPRVSLHVNVLGEVDSQR